MCFTVCTVVSPTMNLRGRIFGLFLRLRLLLFVTDNQEIAIINLGQSREGLNRSLFCLRKMQLNSHLIKSDSFNEYKLLLVGAKQLTQCSNRVKFTSEVYTIMLLGTIYELFTSQAFHQIIN